MLESMIQSRSDARGGLGRRHRRYEGPTQHALGGIGCRQVSGEAVSTVNRIGEEWSATRPIAVCSTRSGPNRSRRSAMPLPTRHGRSPNARPVGQSSAGTSSGSTALTGWHASGQSAVGGDTAEPRDRAQARGLGCALRGRGRRPRPGRMSTAPARSRSATALPRPDKA